ncbi:MAG: AAA family ATPase, partial [Candidatus Udaeobacter sp.]
MLKELQLRNFKIWEDTGPIKMAPLTIFFGTNSSGKSSIEQFLLMLKQTVDSSDRKMVIYPGDVNTPVNLGSFEELVFCRNPQNTLDFSVEWELSEPLTITNPRSSFVATGDRMRFGAKVGMTGERHRILGVSEFEYQLKQSDTLEMSVRLERKAGTRIEYKLE